MTFWQFLDRWTARRAAQARPFDMRLLVGAGFLAGYYFMVYRFMTVNIPADNVALIRDAMLVLGPPVGAIVAAMFRSDIRDEQATRNTGKMADAITATANANSTPGGLKDGDSVTLNAKDMNNA